MGDKYRKSTFLRRRDGDALIRGMALGLILAGHLLVLIWLDAPASPPTGARSPAPGHHRLDALSVRLLAPAAISAEPMPAARRASQRHIASTRKADRHGPIVAASSAHPTEPPRQKSPTLAVISDMASSAPPNPKVPGYVPGGGRLQASLPGAALAQLPGASYSSLPPIPMHAAAENPLNRIVGTLRSLAGGKDPACIDVDAWLALPTEALVARHISPHDIARLREEHRGEEPAHHLLVTF